MSRAWKTDTQSLPSKRLRSSSAPSKSLCTYCFMRAKSLPNRRIFRSASLSVTLGGAVQGRMLECCRNSADFWAEQKEPTGGCCFSWRRRWRGGRQFNGSERLAFIGSLLLHLCPPRLLSLTYLSSGGGRKGSPLAVLGRR